MNSIKFMVAALPLLLNMSCKKDKGFDLAKAPYTDLAILDSAKNTPYAFKQNALQTGTNGPHGTYKLRFNSVAHQVLDSVGFLPQNKSFPEGSIISKEVYKDGKLELYAIMHKLDGAWRWGELEPNGTIIYRMTNDLRICTSCHEQGGNRDMVLTFKYATP